MLACPSCGGSLRFVPEADGANGLLRHDDAWCSEAYPVIEGIPRLLLGAPRCRLVRQRQEWFDRRPELRTLAARWLGTAARDDRVVRGFDYEWDRFRSVDTQDIRDVFELYFDGIAPERLADGQVVVDAGCGAGRWAYQVAARGPRVIAVDLGLSIEAAAASTSAIGRVACVQADLEALPLRPGAVSWAYSLGVLHHLERPVDALRQIVRAVRPGGVVLVYVYYRVDARGRAFRALFGAVNAVRTVTSRLPRPLAYVVAAAFAGFAYWPLARTSSLLLRVGARSLSEALPLAFYRDRSFRFMLNDSLDRFGTTLERRYSRQGLRELMAAAGLRTIRTSESQPFWHAVGDVPAPEAS